MNDIPLLEWAEQYNGYVLMKFTNEYRFQQDFLNGKLFFNTADYFARCEEKGRGDGNEGNTFVMNVANHNYESAHFEIINGEPVIIVTNYSENPDEYKPTTVFDYSSAENRRRKIICLYTAYLNLDKQKVSDFPHNMIDEFGVFGVLITNRQEFFKRVAKAFAKIDFEDAQMGFVVYQDLKPGLNDWNPFRKERESYNYQNEFRITFLNDNEDTYKLDLGCSLKDIAVPIMAKDVDRIKIINGKLYYPKRTVYFTLQKIYYKAISIIKGE